MNSLVRISFRPISETGSTMLIFNRKSSWILSDWNPNYIKLTFRDDPSLTAYELECKSAYLNLMMASVADMSLYWTLEFYGRAMEVSNTEGSPVFAPIKDGEMAPPTSAKKVVALEMLDTTVSWLDENLTWLKMTADQAQSLLVEPPTTPHLASMLAQLKSQSPRMNVELQDYYSPIQVGPFNIELARAADSMRSEQAKLKARVPCGRMQQQRQLYPLNYE